MKRLRLKDITLLETDNYLFVNKPSGMSSLHEREMDGSSLLEQLQTEGSDLQLCHRLDKETSGVLLLAKNPEAYRSASIQFERRQVKKTYHAVIGGAIQLDDVTIDLPLVSTRSGRSKVSVSKGKPSQTQLQTLERFKHYTLVEARPITGRLHQIRAHLASQNAAIAGDQAYQGKVPYLSELKRNFSLGKHKEEQAMIKRVALHAHSLEFNDLDGSPLKAEAPYPKDLEVFIKQLRKYDAASF